MPGCVDFKPDSSYVILNDCYGVNTKASVVESGNCVFDAARKEIRLKNKEFIANHGLHHINKSLVLYVVALTGQTLKISFTDQPGAVAECYKKLD